MSVLTQQQIQAAGQIQSKLDEMNDLLRRVGRLADDLINGGYDVCMTLYDRDRGGHTVNGRLQSNLCKVSIRPAQ